MSNVLEENVIILKFDNSDFQKNTEESIKSLDKLKSKIRDSNSSEGLKGFDKASKSFNLDGMSKAVDKVNKRFSLFGVAGMATINRLTNSAITATKNLITGIPNQIIKGGWQRALNIEQAKNLIEGLKFAWDETSEAYEKGMKTVKTAVDNAVTGTRYSLDEAAIVASQLLSSGVKDTNKLEESLKSISGLASVLNADYSDIGRIFSQVSGQGRMMGDDLLQLQQRGIGAAEEIGKYLTKNEAAKKAAIDTAIATGRTVDKFEEIRKHSQITGADVRELVSVGAIDFDILSNSFRDMFEQAEKANDTYTGSLANLKSAMNRIGESFETYKLQNFTKLFNALIPLFKKFKTVTDPIAKIIGTISNTAMDTLIKKVINPLEKKINPKKINKFFEQFGLGAEKAANSTDKTSKSTKKLTDKLKVSTKEWQAALDIWYKGTYGNDQKRADSIRKLGMSYENVQGIINKFYASGFDWKKTEAAYAVTDEVVKTNEKLGESASNAEPKLSNLGAGLTGVINIAKSFKNVLSGLWNILVGVAKSIKNALVEPAKKGASAFASLTKHLVKVTDKFAKFSKKLRDPQFLKTFASDQFNKLPNVIKFIFRSLSDGLSWVVSHIGPAFSSIKNFFSELSNSEGVQKLKAVLSDLFGSISNTASGALKTVVDHIKSLANIGSGGGLSRIVDFFSRLAGSLADFISNVRSGKNPFKLLADGIGGLIGKISFKGLGGDGLGAKISSIFNFDFFSNIGDKIKNIGIGDKLKNAFSSIFSSIQDGVPLDKLKDLKFGEFFKSLGEKLGAVDWKTLTELATKIGGLALGFKALKDMGNLTDAAVGTMGSMSGFFNSLGGLSDTIKKKIKINTFKTVAICIAVLTACVVALSMIPLGNLIPAMTGVLLMLGSLVAIIKILTSDKIDAEKLKGVGIAFAGIGSAVLLIGIAMAVISKIKVSDIVKAGLTIAAFMGMLVLVSKLSGDISGSGGAFAGLATAVNILVVAMLAVAAMSMATILKGGLVILGLVTSLGLAARIANSSKSGGFVSMATAVNSLVPAITAFALMPFEMILKGGATVVGLVTSLALAARLAGNGSLKGLAGITVTISVLTASMVILSALDTAKLIASGSALVALITSLSIASKLAKGSVAGIISMALMLGILTASLVILNKLDITASLTICASLSLLALSLGAALMLFAVLGPHGAALGVAGFAIAVAGIGSIFALVGLLQTKLKEYDIAGFINAGIPIFVALASGMGQMIGAFVSGLAAQLLTGGLPIMAENLSKFMEKLQPFFDSVSDRASIAATVESISEMAKAFALLGAGNLMNSISSFLGGENVDMESFGDQLAKFANGFKKFAEEAGKISPKDLSSALIIAKITKVFAEVQSSFESSGGVKGFIFGNKEDLASFGEQLGSLVDAVALIVLKLRMFQITDEDAELIKPVIKIIKAFAGLELPKSGGVAQFFTGNTTIGEFGSSLKSFIESFGEFIPALRELEIGDDILGEDGKLAKVISVLKTMIEVGSTIPPSEGLAQLVSGNTTLPEFANQLCMFIPGFKRFITSTADIDPATFEDALTKVNPIVKAVKAMAGASETIPESGGLKQVWTGGKNLGTFAIQLNTFARNLKPFLTTIKDVTISPDVTKKIDQLSVVVKSMAKVSDAVPDDESVFKKLGKLIKLKIDKSAISTVMDSVKAISENSEGLELGDVKKLRDAISLISEMAGNFGALKNIPTGANLPKLASNAASYISTLKEVDTKGIAGKAKDIKSAINQLSKAANTKIKSSDGNKSNTSSGKAIGDAFAKGISGTQSSVKKAAEKLPKAAKEGVKSNTSGFRRAGKNCGQGFADGILAKKSTVGSAGTAIGNYAYEKAMAAIAAKSPSRKFMKVGNYAGEGFAIGLLELKKKVGDSAYEMATASIEGANRAITAIDDMSSPVITPVIDMSKVQTGAQQINSLLSSNTALSVNSVVEGNLAAQYERSKTMDKLADLITSKNGINSNRTNNFTFNVDGSTNPEAFAEQLMRGLEMRTRS